MNLLYPILSLLKMKRVNNFINCIHFDYLICSLQKKYRYCLKFSIFIYPINILSTQTIENKCIQIILNQHIYTIPREHSSYKKVLHKL